MRPSSVQGDFQANILALANVYGVDATAGFNAALVDSVIAKIKADVSANLQGGITVAYKAPACQASVDVAVQAQAQCEAKANCDVKVDPGHATVSARASATGKCSGMCSGSASCTSRRRPWTAPERVRAPASSLRPRAATAPATASAARAAA